MTDASSPNNWFVCPQPIPGAETRLFLFPYAGGGPAVFGKWLAGLPDTIETWTAHYPGRGSRHSETPIKRILPLVEKLVQAIQPILDKPFVFFGHSLGGLVAFELARQLHQQDLAGPQILFVSACGAPQTPDPHPRIHTLPDSQFLRALQELKGIPPELINLPKLMDFILPALRDDYEAIETYVYKPNRPRLNCPIIAFGGLDDPRVSRERLEGWALLTDAGFKLQLFPGDHFFINTARDAVIVSLIDQLISSHANN